jgi:hypothetical protein
LRADTVIPTPPHDPGAGWADNDAPAKLVATIASDTVVSYRAAFGTLSDMDHAAKGRSACTALQPHAGLGMAKRFEGTEECRAAMDARALPCAQITRGDQLRADTTGGGSWPTLTLWQSQKTKGNPVTSRPLLPFVMKGRPKGHFADSFDRLAESQRLIRRRGTSGGNSSQ